MDILLMTNAHPDFYRLIGPFLGCREVHKEMGGPLWDDLQKYWWIACDPQKAVLGFAAVLCKADGRICHFCSAYVLPAYRKQGIHALLIDARLSYCRASQPIALLTVTANHLSLNAYLQRGFVTTRKNGRYTVLEKRGSNG